MHLGREEKSILHLCSRPFRPLSGLGWGGTLRDSAGTPISWGGLWATGSPYLSGRVLLARLELEEPAA